jgi:hypothetical protein
MYAFGISSMDFEGEIQIRAMIFKARNGRE